MPFAAAGGGWWRLLGVAILLATGCATVGPVALRDELAKPKAAIHSEGGQEIRGYFDGNGLYHKLEGDLRARDGQLQVREYSADRSRESWVIASPDTMMTIMVERSNGRYGLVLGATLLAAAAVLIGIYLFGQ